MKKLHIFPIILLVLLAACSDELPPTPPPPGQAGGIGKAIAGMAGAMPAWAAEAKNVAVTPTQVYLNDGIIVTASEYNYIYSNGYFFNSKNRVWEKFPLQGELQKDWVKGQAVSSLAISPEKFSEGDNFLVIYACNKQAGTWDCNGKKWMLVPFKVLGSAKGQIPEMANIEKFVINKGIEPFAILKTNAEKDNFLDVNVIRYDAQYRAPTGLIVLAQVFDFNTRQELDQTLKSLFKDIVNNGWKVHAGNNVAVFLGDTDHRIATWSSGKQLVYIDTFQSASANKEIIDAYVRKYPSDLQKQ